MVDCYLWLKDITDNEVHHVRGRLLGCSPPLFVSFYFFPFDLSDMFKHLVFISLIRRDQVPESGDSGGA